MVQTIVITGRFGEQPFHKVKYETGRGKKKKEDREPRHEVERCDICREWFSAGEHPVCPNALDRYIDLLQRQIEAIGK